MKFKQFVLKEEDTGTNGLTIYHPKVYMPKKGPDGKTWREEATEFYNKLPDTLTNTAHAADRALQRLADIGFDKKDLGDVNTFINNIYEFKYDNGKLVGVSVNLYNLEKNPKFADVVMEKHRYPIAIVNTPILITKGPEIYWSKEQGKMIETGKTVNHETRDLKKYATVGEVKTVMTPILAFDDKGNRKPITTSGTYCLDDTRGRKPKIKPLYK